MSCAICLRENIRGPMTLDCGHIFCTVCIYEWRFERPVRGCPLCRDSITFFFNSPIWNMNISRFFEKGESPLLSQEEIDGLKYEFGLSKLDLSPSIPDTYSGTVIMLYSNVAIIGTLTIGERILNKCISFERDSGKAYPTHPRTRQLLDDTIYYLT